MTRTWSTSAGCYFLLLLARRRDFETASTNTTDICSGGRALLYTSLSNQPNTLLPTTHPPFTSSNPPLYRIVYVPQFFPLLALRAEQRHSYPILFAKWWHALSITNGYISPIRMLVWAAALHPPNDVWLFFIGGNQAGMYVHRLKELNTSGFLILCCFVCLTMGRDRGDTKT